ncbi:hypothetical protein C8F04DRAFT_1194065 [Mycena alexandri]|uniref:Uncharacterized protein n=1 Tax=Mycena alexandri TaxID=1745969 RepID=A0AAD6S9I0_9AGAR|nr:hypothetical protein C8F04DRAFT_1194065 [Mycena alexandri]
MYPLRKSKIKLLGWVIGNGRQSLEKASVTQDGTQTEPGGAQVSASAYMYGISSWVFRRSIGPARAYLSCESRRGWKTNRIRENALNSHSRAVAPASNGTEQVMERTGRYRTVTHACAGLSSRGDLGPVQLKVLFLRANCERGLGGETHRSRGIPGLRTAVEKRNEGPERQRQGDYALEHEEWDVEIVLPGANFGPPSRCRVCIWKSKWAGIKFKNSKGSAKVPNAVHPEAGVGAGLVVEPLKKVTPRTYGRLKRDGGGAKEAGRAD